MICFFAACVLFFAFAFFFFSLPPALLFSPAFFGVNFCVCAFLPLPHRVFGFRYGLRRVDLRVFDFSLFCVFSLLACAFFDVSLVFVSLSLLFLAYSVGFLFLRFSPFFVFSPSFGVVRARVCVRWFIVCVCVFILDEV